MKTVESEWAAFAAVTLLTLLAMATIGPVVLTATLDAWDADTCWSLDRQNRNGFEVGVPDYCAPHGYTPRAPGVAG